MIKAFIALFIEKFLVAMFKAISDYFKEQREISKQKKQIKIKIKEVMSEKDTQIRAKRLADLLNS